LWYEITYFENEFSRQFFFHLFQKSARQQAEKRFKSVLEKGGVSEEEISRIISLSEN